MVKAGIEGRLTDSVENALSISDGLLRGRYYRRGTYEFQSELFLPGLRHQYRRDRTEKFSFNNPFGACPECFGLGYKMEFDERLMIPDETLSINQGPSR